MRELNSKEAKAVTGGFYAVGWWLITMAVYGLAHLNEKGHPPSTLDLIEHGK